MGLLRVDGGCRAGGLLPVRPAGPDGGDVGRPRGVLRG